MISIGALSRASGIPVATLRTWERRYGYPAAERKPSGHRLYHPSCAPRLQRMASALARGHRAREVLTASDLELDEMLAVTRSPGGFADRSGFAPSAGLDLEEMLSAVRLFDSEALTRRMADCWTRLGPLRFLTECVAPLLGAIGDAWATGALEIRHEHFVSERLADVLRAIRLPFEDRASGPVVVLATLPGELHGFGLQMVALLLAVHGCRGRSLGTDAPLEEIARMAAELRASAVALSVSQAAEPALTRRRLVRLQRTLPSGVALVAGGSGARSLGSVPRVETLPDLVAADSWAHGIAAAG